MDIWNRYVSPSGYHMNDDGTDSLGVNHSNFSLRDEIAYQMNRVNNEEQQQSILPQASATIDQAPTPWNNQKQTPVFQTQTPTSWSSQNQTPVFQTQTPTPWSGQTQIAQQSAQNQTIIPRNPDGTMIVPTQTPTPWRNNQTLTPWNGGYDMNGYISDEDLYAKMWENIKQHENIVPHPYLDTKGLITIGGGANVNDWNVFKNLNVTVGGIPATEAQKREAYNHMRQLSGEKDANGNYVNRNIQADKFADKTNIRISDTEARGLAQNHMNNDLTHLRGEFINFDEFPLPLKEVLLDIQYNVKGGVNQQNWPNLYDAIRNRDVNGIVSNVHRKDVAPRRNNWARDMVRSIRF